MSTLKARKKLSFTATRRAELKQAQNTVLQLARMSEDEYGALMFDIGSRFAENFSGLFLERETLFKSLLYDASYGFWPWWKMKWKMDDAALIKKGCFEDNITYQEMKETMIGDSLFVKELYHTIDKHI